MTGGDISKAAIAAKRVNKVKVEKKKSVSRQSRRQSETDVNSTSEGLEHVKLAQSQMVVAKHAKTAARKINTNQQKNPKHHATPMRRRGRRSLTSDDDFAILAGSHTLESNASNMFEQHRRHEDMLNLENSKISKEVVGTMGSIKAVGSWKRKTKESREKEAEKELDMNAIKEENEEKDENDSDSDSENDSENASQNGSQKGSESSTDSENDETEEKSDEKDSMEKLLERQRMEVKLDRQRRLEEQRKDKETRKISEEKELDKKINSLFSRDEEDDSDY